MPASRFPEFLNQAQRYLRERFMASDHDAEVLANLVDAAYRKGWQEAEMTIAHGVYHGEDMVG